MSPMSPPALPGVPADAPQDPPVPVQAPEPSLGREVIPLGSGRSSAWSLAEARAAGWVELMVTCSLPNRRRGGMDFPRGKSILQLSDLDEGKYAAIVGDHYLRKFLRRGR